MCDVSSDPANRYKAARKVALQGQQQELIKRHETLATLVSSLKVVVLNPLDECTVTPENIKEYATVSQNVINSIQKLRAETLEILNSVCGGA